MRPVKLLFAAGGSPSTVFAIAPLATASRLAGHEILLATDEPVLPAARGLGLPAVPAPAPADLPGRLAALRVITEDWTPDIICGGLSYAPGLLAVGLGVPYVRQYWDISPLRDEEGLEAEYQAIGLHAPPAADLFIDVCPPCLRPASDRPTQFMRWIPRNSQSALEPWMYRTPDRPRVLISFGTRAKSQQTASPNLVTLVDALVSLGAEVVITSPPGQPPPIEGSDTVRAGFVPLDVIAPTCALAITHGGAATATTLMNAGVPQVFLPKSPYARSIAETISAFGGAETVLPQMQQEEQMVVLTRTCRQILFEDRYRSRAGVLAGRMAQAPPTSVVVERMEEIVAGNRGDAGRTRRIGGGLPSLPAHD